MKENVFTVGNITAIIAVAISTFALFLTLLKFHKENKTNIQKGISELEEMKAKVNKMFTWFDSDKLPRLEARMELIYKLWFKGDEETHESSGD